MSKYAAFLRGVNLGARRRISSAQLRSLFEESGFGAVATFRSSGNVVFEAAREPRAKLAERIERAFLESLGWESKVFLRTAAELRAIVGHEPFDAKLVDASEGKRGRPAGRGNARALLAARPWRRPLRARLQRDGRLARRDDRADEGDDRAAGREAR